MASALSDIFAEAARRLWTIKVDVSVSPPIAEYFKVRIIPTLLIFKHGVSVKFVMGLVPSRFIVQTIRRAIGAVSKHGVVEGAGRC
jgi:thioredoxin-like negative regulator of GroEL